MSSRREDPRRKPAPAWHAKLLAMLPKIIRFAKRAFRSYRPEAREEAVQNVIANTTATVAGLAKRGKLDLCYPTVLAQFGIRQTLDHRKTGSSQNVKDVLSKYCQEHKAVTVDQDALRDAVYAEAQRLVEHTAASPENIQAAKRAAETALKAIYAEFGWTLIVKWDSDAPAAH